MKNITTVLAAMTLATQAWAYDFKSGDLYYNIDGMASVAEVTYETSYSGLTTAIIPSKVTDPNSGQEYPVTSIGDYAFNGRSSLSSVTIPESVTSIGSSAFSGCSGLTSVTIPNSVKSIGDYAFDGCSGLTAINVESANTNYTSANGILFNKDKTTILCYPAGKTETTYTIPNSVTSIGGWAFYDCSGLTSVTIPNSVTSIGGAAFRGCSGLTTVAIPNSVTSIGSSAFSDCSKLTEINVESANTNYTSESGVLFNKDKTTIVCYPAGKTETTYTIPNTVTSIGSGAFWGCSGLTSVTIPNTVTSIGWYAFYGCSGLTSVTIPNSVTSIGLEAFSGCSGLTLVTVPNSVTSIGSGAFWGCSGLTSVTIPEGVTSIAGQMFCGCSSLTSVTIPNSVTSIGSGAFLGCSGLTSLTIPNSVTSIDGFVFQNCSSLIAVTIGNSVTSIGDYAFYNCWGLTSVTIPNSVKSIGDYAFYGCSGLTAINVESANTNYTSANGILFNKDKTTILCYPAGKTETTYTIPNSVTSIGNDAFVNCSSLTSVTIPNSVTSIGDIAFGDCTGLTSVTIPNSVTSIGSSAFSYCNGLTSVTIGNSVTSIGSYAFAYCRGLTYIVYDGTSAPTIGTDAFINVNSSVKVCVPENYSSDKFGGFGVYKGHNKVTDQAVSPTCTETGLTEGVHCSNCGRVFVAQEESEPPLGHLFTNYIYNNDATTEADGTETAECEHGCGTTNTRTAIGTRLHSDPTSMDETITAEVTIRVIDKCIVVENADSDIYVYDVTGRTIAHQTPQSQNVIAVGNNGVYFVTSGDAVKKVVIK